MSIWHAVVLGIVQGVGEFAPISSSGHLIVVPWLFGWGHDQGLAFDVSLHAGTLVALIAYFWRDLIRLLTGYFAGWTQDRFWAAQRRYLLPLVLGCFPAAVAGKLLEERAETAFRSPALVACTMAGMGLVLFAADRLGRKSRSLSETGPAAWLAVGLSQCLALVPGVSRSGVTISAGLAAGMTRESAARFSFLLSIPIVFGAVALQGRKLLKHGIPADERMAFAVGILTAAVFGYLCIRYLLAYLRTRSLDVFVGYRLAFAVIVGLLLLAR